MNAFERNIGLRVLGIHVAVILGFLIVSGLKGCFRAKPKPEIVTFIEFGAPAPQVDVQQVSQLSEPEPPAPAPRPEPAPVPEPVKKTIPKPTLKPTPKPTLKPKPEPKSEPEKPKWKPTPASAINPNKSKRIVETPSKPALDSKEISRAMKNIQQPASRKTTDSVGTSDAANAYISQIGSFFDKRWVKPESSAPAASAVIRIYISTWGTITRRSKIQGSGDTAFDASVMSAVNSVSTVPKPPSGFPYEYVEVEFRIRN